MTSHDLSLIFNISYITILEGIEGYKSISVLIKKLFWAGARPFLAFATSETSLMPQKFSRTLKHERKLLQKKHHNSRCFCFILKWGWRHQFAPFGLIRRLDVNSPALGAGSSHGVRKPNRFGDSFLRQRVLWESQQEHWREAEGTRNSILTKLYSYCALVYLFCRPQCRFHQSQAAMPMQLAC